LGPLGERLYIDPPLLIVPAPLGPASLAITVHFVLYTRFAHPNGITYQLAISRRRRVPDVTRAERVGIAERRALSHRKAIEVVGKLYRPRISFLDFRQGLSLLRLTQSPQHAMRQNQLLDMGIAGDLPNHGRGHV